MKKVTILLLLMICLLSACSKDPRSICNKHLKEEEGEEFFVYVPERIEEKNSPDDKYFTYRLTPQIVLMKNNSDYELKVGVDFYNPQILHLTSIVINGVSFDLEYGLVTEIEGQYLGRYTLKADAVSIAAMSEMAKKNTNTIQIISEEETHDFILTPEMIKQFRYVLDAYNQLEKLEV